GSGPDTERAGWLLEQLSDSSVRAFAVKYLEDHPDVLERWFPILLGARLFTVPPVPTNKEESVEVAWPVGRLLEVAATHRVPGIVEALQAVPPTGPNATWLLVRAFIAIDDPHSVAELVPTVVRWLTEAPGAIFDVPDLASKVI